METQGFFEQALVYLAAGVIAVPIAKRLGLGAVLGYLVAGMAIGPWGLRLISNPETVLHFAEFGVVLLLFLVGLELNPQRVWALRRSILGLGAVQVVVTIAAVAGIAKLIGQSWIVGLVAGMGIAMSSTAIGLASLAEKNLLQTPGGQASFSVLLFQDLAVIPLLLVLGFLGGETDAFGWTDAAKAVGFIAALILAGRVLVRPALQFIAETRLREIFVGFSLLLVVGAAVLADKVGLSMALGAFLAGVMLADSEYRHELQLDIDPFKGLLLGLFFIAVGMSIDLSLYGKLPLVIFGLAAGIVLLKMVLLYPVAKTFGYCNRADASLFALALSQAGEFAFVIFGAARAIVPAETVAILNAAVATSMMTTPLLLMVYERYLARRIDRGSAAPPDAIHETNPVIVAGFGRFGQVVVRVLRGLDIGTTVIDQDPTQIETVRRFGYKAYYGDATRLDLLESAGADKARVLLLVIDDPDAALEAVKRIRARFPMLEIVARARGRTDAYEYAALGISAVREVFGSALQAAMMTLKVLGYGEADIKRIIGRFREHDERQVIEGAQHRNDMSKLIALNEQGRRDIAQLLAAETASAPQIDQDNAGRDQQRGDGEGPR